MKNLTVNTWLPVFPGFYSTNFEPDETMEIDHINETRRDNGLTELHYDNLKFDYLQYEQDVAKKACECIENELKEFLTAIHFQIVSSPREYNFTNDSIHVAIELSPANIKRIKSYLRKNLNNFAIYIKSNYSSCDGFISHYDSDAVYWLAEIDECIEHEHKLGAILQFIAFNEDEHIESSMLEYCSDCYLQVENYDECTTQEYCPICNEFYNPALKKNNVCPDCYEYRVKNLDVFTCAKCGQEITNKWFVRSLLHQIKHGLITPDQIYCCQ